MKNENRQQKIDREAVLVRGVDAVLYRHFCNRATDLGVPAEAVLQEILERGMSEWIRMRSKSMAA